MKNRKKIKISIIMPCYNSEKYLEKTLDTVCKQTFKDYELICVNDGSTDNTIHILNKYAKKYENIKVISKENAGGTVAALHGLKHISGDYVCIIDNDDYLSPNYLEELFNSINKYNADMAVCAFQREDFETRKVYSKEMIRKDGIYYLNEDYGLLLEINTSLWNKIFKKDIILELLNFNINSIGLGDMTLMAYMYKKINKIAFNSKILYFYQVRMGSDINSMKSDAIDNIYDNLIRIKDSYKRDCKERLDILDAYAFLHLGVSLMYRIYRTKNADFNKILKDNTEKMDKYFSHWRKNKYYSLKYVLLHKMRNLKLHICSIFYKLHLFRFFISMYDFITTKLKFDIKW